MPGERSYVVNYNHCMQIEHAVLQSSPVTNKYFQGMYERSRRDMSAAILLRGLESKSTCAW